MSCHTSILSPKTEQDVWMAGRTGKQYKCLTLKDKLLSNFPLFVLTIFLHLFA